MGRLGRASHVTRPENIISCKHPLEVPIIYDHDPSPQSINMRTYLIFFLVVFYGSLCDHDSSTRRNLICETIESFDQKTFLLSSWDAQNHRKLESILTTEANP